MWEDNTSKIRVIPFPEAVVNKLLAYKKDKLEPNMDSLQYAYEEEKEKLHPSVFNVPSFVSLREYQTQAVLEWKKQGYHGIFSMCTGSGKTFTGLAAMCMLGKEERCAGSVHYMPIYSSGKSMGGRTVGLELYAHCLSHRHRIKDGMTNF